MTLPQPIPYSADLEQPGPDEEKVQAELNETFDYIVTKTHADLGHAQRGVHAKSHALLEAELRVHDDLPEELSQGIFAERGRRYPALVRISAIAGDPLRDSVSLPRGFAIKVVGVDGPRLVESASDVTQDFLFATAPVFAAPDAKAFLKSLKLTAMTTDRAEWAKAALSMVLRPLTRGIKGLGLNGSVLHGFGGYPPTNPLGDRYYTQVPLRFGAYVAKLDLVPESPNFRALTGAPIDVARARDAIREEIGALLASEGGSWTLRAQLCRDLASNPIEDASVAWPEGGNPYLPVATVSVAPQTSWTRERSRIVDDATSFRPWHGIEAHRPLGSIMRARKTAYPFSAERRSALNECPIHEPRSMVPLPAGSGREHEKP